VKVVVYQGDDGFWYWHLKAENGEIISDSAEGYRHTRPTRSAWPRSSIRMPSW
jgi:uncharacterized protein YegP (UPF0339 family)